MKNQKNNRKTLIAFDMDGVLFDFATKYAKEYTLIHPDDPKTGNDILQGWDVGKTTKYGDKLWKNPSFFATMKPYMDYFEVFRWAYANYECFVITTCPHHLCAEKTEALKLYMPKFHDWDIVFCNRKELLKYDYIFEDAPHNIEISKERCVVVTRPYNEEISAKFRVNNVREMRQFIEEHCNKK